MTLVDLICIVKSSLFCALSTTLTFDDKNKVWEDIEGKFSEHHEQMRTKDDVSKNGVISSASINLALLTNLHRQRGGGPADAQLDELELKISSNKGRKCFEDIEQGINLCTSSVEVVDESLMVISPTLKVG